MKKIIAFTLGLTLSFAMLTGCSSKKATDSPALSPSNGTETSTAADDSSVYELKLAHIYAADHAFNIGCEKIAENIKEKTNGKVVISVFPAAQLGAETAEINSLQVGAIDICVLGSGEVAKRVNDFHIFDAPYLFKDCAEAEKAAKSEVIQPIFKECEKYGFTVENMLYYGVRNLTTKFEVNSPKDTEGLKLRVPDNAIPRYISEYVFKAAPTPMSLSEVYLALQQGVVDGQENPIPTIYTQKFHEVCDYINLTKHQISYFPTIMSNATREKLPKEYVEIIDECFAEGAPMINQMVLDAEDEILQKMIDEGVTAHEPSDLAAFKESVSKLVEKCETDGLWREGLYDEIKAAVNA